MSLKPQFTHYFRTLVAQYEPAHPTVELEWVDVPWDAMPTELTTAIVARSAPALVQLDVPWAYDYALYGALRPIDDLLGAGRNQYTAGVILPTLAGAIGIFILKTAFEEIPQDLLDAARVDGASELYIFLRIMLPRAGPQIAALVILTAVTTWNQFLWPSVVLTKSELMPLAVGILELSGTFGSSTRIIAAGAVLTIAPALLVFFFAQRYFMRVMEGAVK